MTAASIPIPWTRYIALGDSFTEGLCDDVTEGSPETRTPIYRGWADRLAYHLDRRSRSAGGQGLDYANLAVRGKLLRGILDEQLSPALAQKPDLVSLVGGGNDMLRPATSVDALALQLERAVIALRRRNIDVLLATSVDPKDSPLISRTRSRIGVYNSAIWSIARRHGAYVIDQWGMASLLDLRLWAPDRIHLTPEGHERVAQAALVALGLTPDTADWDVPLAAGPHATWSNSAREDARWFRTHALPWATRRLRRRSSGDEKVAKRPLARPVGEPSRPRSTQD